MQIKKDKGARRMKGDEAEDLMKHRRGSRRKRSQGGMKEQAGGGEGVQGCAHRAEV